MTVAFLQQNVGFCNAITFTYICYCLLIESYPRLCNSKRMTDYLSKLLMLLCLFALSLTAKAEKVSQSNCLLLSNKEELSSKATIPLCEELYPESHYFQKDSPWRIGLSAGIGQRSNPLLNARDIPVYGVLHISYFGDRFFFDNGDIGWRLFESENSSINAIAGVGGERSFYSFLNDSPISFFEAVDVANGAVIKEEAIKAPQREMVVDGGIEWLWTYGNSDLQVQLLTDISNQHNGQEFWLSAGHTLNYKNGQYPRPLVLTGKVTMPLVTTMVLPTTSPCQAFPSIVWVQLSTLFFDSAPTMHCQLIGLSSHCFSMST